MPLRLHELCRCLPLQLHGPEKRLLLVTHRLHQMNPLDGLLASS